MFVDIGGAAPPKGAAGRNFQNTKASTFALSRRVRSNRYELICNVTPKMQDRAQSDRERNASRPTVTRARHRKKPATYSREIRPIKSLG